MSSIKNTHTGVTSFTTTIWPFSFGRIALLLRGVKLCFLFSCCFAVSSFVFCFRSAGLPCCFAVSSFVFCFRSAGLPWGLGLDAFGRAPALGWSIRPAHGFGQIAGQSWRRL